MTLTSVQLAAAGLIGIVAGVLGGLAGIGGSMIMLPALHFVFGEKSESTHHMYMAAAMTVNVAVALPAAWRHRKAGAVRTDLLPILLASTIVAVVTGVMLSNQLLGDDLRIGLAIFLLIYCTYNTLRLVRESAEPAGAAERTSPANLMVSGAATGMIGGLLGLGGGVMLVPMLQMLCRVPLRQSIATSSAVMCITAVFGAGLKLWTLPGEGESPTAALVLAAAMAPTAMIGGVIGASLTHKLSIRLVRLAVTLLLLGASAKLGGLW